MLFERDKWLQYGILRDEPSLVARLPETQLLEKDTLTKMLLQYPSVVLKPRNGSYGKDILFIQRSGANAYLIQNENKTVTMRDNEQLLEWLEQTIKSDEYIVQKRLQLAQIKQKPFDIRIMVQRKKGSSSTWNVTGSYAKVAAQGYLVTNVNKRTIPVLKALKLARLGDRLLLAKAEQIARLAAQRLGEHYPMIRQVGFDIAVDKKRRIWIIEGNYQPDLRPFRLMKDSSMHRRILWYKEH
ncbi:YheC/YheD family protein [Paenibacillus sp. LS1]|uniref:YheC/YheD family protein n=1 Tax=Paenibacillus sp. LS1 TaxID=2992120 RepID=UPI0022318C57|nr:YheC/YheD family protein [Paenibacillus sp. LS1]MCW3793275.1 YheC/YheD family protein [Paenibacillus sp. LS1]